MNKKQIKQSKNPPLCKCGCRIFVKKNIQTGKFIEITLISI